MANALVVLGIMFGAALLGGALAVRIRQPAVIGLLLVGALLGPNMLGIVNEPVLLDKLIEFGSIMMLFVLGLEFVLPRMMKNGFRAMMLSLFKVGLTYFVTYQVLFWLGYSPLLALMAGIMVSFSSTVVFVKILQSKRLYDRQDMPLLVGILIFEDIVAVLILTIVTSAGAGLSVLPMLEGLVIALLLLAVSYMLAIRILPRAIGWLTRSTGDEAVVFSALGLCALFSYLSYFLGLSPSIGAFLAGSIMASLPDARRFKGSVLPYSSMFTALFFLAIGTMFDLSAVRAHAALVALLLLLVIVTRLLSVGLVGYLFAGFRKEQIVFSSIAMLAVSEFSLLIARAANPLLPGIDMVSVAAAVVFGSSILLSLSVGYAGSAFQVMDSHVPRRLKRFSLQLSDYIRLAFDELSIEGVHTRRFRRSVSRLLLILLAMLVAVVVWGRLKGQLVLISFAAAAIMVLLSVLLWRNARQAYLSLVNVLAGLETARCLSRSRLILRRLVVVLLLLFAAILMPLAMTGLSGRLLYIMNLAPFAVLLLAFAYLRSASYAIANFSSARSVFPRYRKLKPQ